jgi:Polyketide cyclase / dehydrase and lipid transport
VAILTLSQVIPRPVGDVFDTVIDGARFPDWNPTVKSARRLTEGPIRDGTRFEWELSGFGRVVQELAEFDRNRRVRIVPHLSSLKGGHRFTFTSVPEGTRIDHELEMLPQGLYSLLGPITSAVGRRNLRATATALEKHLTTRR